MCFAYGGVVLVWLSQGPCEEWQVQISLNLTQILTLKGGEVIVYIQTHWIYSLTKIGPLCTCV